MKTERRFSKMKRRSVKIKRRFDKTETAFYFYPFPNLIFLNEK